MFSIRDWLWLSAVLQFGYTKVVLIKLLFCSVSGRTISDRSILRLEECETCLAPSGVSDMSADIAGKTTCCVVGPNSPLTDRRAVCDSAVSTTKVYFNIVSRWMTDRPIKYKSVWRSATIDVKNVEVKIEKNVKLLHVGSMYSLILMFTKNKWSEVSADFIFR